MTTTNELTRAEKVELVKSILHKHIIKALDKINTYEGLEGLYGTLPAINKYNNPVTIGHIFVRDKSVVYGQTEIGNFDMTDRLYVTGKVDILSDELETKLDESKLTDPNTVGV